MRLKGAVNIVLFVLVIVTVVFSGQLGDLGETIHFPFVREVILVILTILSLKLGPRGPRAANHFHWAPIVEVAVLFAGIFATMIPALALLEAKGETIGLSEPWQYYWLTGVLSSFLDNAPTYLAFTSVAQGQAGVDTIGALTSTQLDTRPQLHAGRLPGSDIVRSGDDGCEQLHRKRAQPDSALSCRALRSAHAFVLGLHGVFRVHPRAHLRHRHPGVLPLGGC